MPAAVANSVVAVGAGVTTVTTGAINTTAGNTLVVFVNTRESGNGQQPSGVPTDNKGNTFVQIGTEQLVTVGGNALWAYYCANAAGGSGHTVTQGFAAAADPSVFFLELSGVVAASFDSGASAQGSDAASPYTVTSGTLAQADEIVLCHIGTDAAINPITHTPGGSFTLAIAQVNGITYWSGAVGYRVVSSTSAVTPSWTVASSGNAGLRVIAFKGTSGPTITAQPVNQTVDFGSTAAFTVAATTSGGALSYQWQDNRSGAFAACVDGTGATTASYTSAAAGQATQGRQYRCVVTDSNGSTTSASAAVGVLAFPVHLWSTAVQSGNDVWLRDPTATAAAGGAVLAATLQAQATLSAALTTSIALSAAAQSASTASAALSTAIALQAAAAGQATVAAALSTAIAAAAAAQATSTVTAALSTGIALVAAAQGATTLTASLATPAAALQASAQAQTTLAAALSTSIALAASAQGVATASAALSTAIRLAAAGQGSTTLTAALSTGIALAAAPVVQATLTAALTTQIRPAATVQGQATLTAALSTAIALAAAPQAVTTLQATLAGGAAALAATVQCGSTVTAALSTAIPLAAAPVAQTTLGAALSTQIAPAASVTVQCTVSAALTTQIRLAAAPQAVTTLQATLAGGAAALAASAQGSCTVTASLSTGVSLACSMAAQASVTALLSTQIRLAAQVQALVTAMAALADAAGARVLPSARQDGQLATDQRGDNLATETRSNAAGPARTTSPTGTRSNAASGTRSNKA